ncbi:MAG: DNA-processing protein DprA [Thermonemataceae bacterium]
MLSKNALSSPTLYEVALSLATGVGGMTARNLLSYCGSAEAVFHTPSSKLLSIPLVGQKIVASLRQKDLLERAAQEIEKSTKLDIQLLSITHPSYPKRLKEIIDAPILLYYKGSADLNMDKIVSIVGTRKATHYGKAFITQFFEEMIFNNILVVSGLAYGIDVMAHKAALQHQLPTVGVMANGLDLVYPSQHQTEVEKMLVQQGGILSESPLGPKPEAPRFPARNRIIAGIADAIIVVEAMQKGGAIITAHLGNDYHRDVFAVPGDIKSATSQGCNQLIKTHKAHLIESVKDLAYIMNWEFTSATNTIQSKTTSVHTLPTEAQKIVRILQKQGTLHIDALSLQVDLSASQLQAHLLQLEMDQWVVGLPGKTYKLFNT